MSATIPWQTFIPKTKPLPYQNPTLTVPNTWRGASGKAL